MNKSIWGNTVKHSFNKKPAGKNHSEKLLWQFAINTCMCPIHVFTVSCMPNFQYAPQFWITVNYIVNFNKYTYTILLRKRCFINESVYIYTTVCNYNSRIGNVQ